MPTASPVRFTPSVEKPQPDEAQTVRDLKETFQKILDTTSKDYGRAVRAVHAKGHGLVRGRLTIAENLPLELAQGLFAQAGTYQAILRFSTAPGDILDDAVSAPRGVALKVLGVPGERLTGSNDGGQDFLMVNGRCSALLRPQRF